MSLSCFHCTELVPDNVHLSVRANNQDNAVCCEGCKAVAETILAGGFAQYYQFRTTKSPTISTAAKLDEYLKYDEPAIQAEFITELSNTERKADIAIEGMHCAACAWLIEQRLLLIEGVSKVQVNSTTQRAQISWRTEQLSVSDLFKAINEIGYHAHPFKLSEQEVRFKQKNSQFLKRVAVAGLMTMQIMMLAFAMYSGVIEPEFELFFRWVSLVLTLPIFCYSAYPIFSSGCRAVLNKTVNMDVPVSIAIMGTFIASLYATITQTGEVYFESVSMFTLLLLLGRYLEHNVKSAAASVTANLLKLIPLSATLKQEDGTYTETSARALIPGQVIRVLEGDALPADGCLINKTCYIDESMLTGESEPVQKREGDQVYAGSILASQTIELTVSAAGAATTLLQIASSDAQISSNSSFVGVADKLAKYFVSAVLLIAAVTFFVWQFLLGGNGFWPMIAVLVATCPCALSLAMPTAMTAAATSLKRSGILVNSTQALETFSKLKTLAFDKTGTLTKGTLAIEHCVWFSPTLLNSKSKQDELLSIVAAIESHSAHPIASAFKPYISNKVVSDINITAGKGIEGYYNEQHLKIGNADYIQHLIPSEHQAARIFITKGSELMGAIYLSDPLREDSSSMLSALTCNKILLSGDKQDSVESVAKQLKLPFEAGLSPEDKVQRLVKLQQTGLVGMVGDGLNDVMVLAQADASVAVANASDLSKQKADIILMNGQLSSINTLFSHSIKLNLIIKQNLLWALSYNTLVLPLACMNILSPYVAVLGMSLSSLLVTINSTRLLKK